MGIIKLFQVNAFTSDSQGGNPAGVVLSADSLSERQMQAIAAKAGFSETAFVLGSSLADQRVRFFTTTQEVRLCGHATMATYHLLFTQGILAEGHHKMETLAGVQNIEIRSGGLCSMTQNLPEFGMELAPELLATALGLELESFSDLLPIRIVSTGLKKIFVPVKTLDELSNIRFDLEMIDRISRDHDAIGVYVFSLETVGDATAHCRNSSPTVGINEESATGTSAGALACNLYHSGLVSDKEAEHLKFEQGYCMGLPSEILVQLEIRSKKIQKVKVLGRSQTFKEMKMDLMDLEN